MCHRFVSRYTISKRCVRAGMEPLNFRANIYIFYIYKMDILGCRYFRLLHDIFVSLEFISFF